MKTNFRVREPYAHIFQECADRFVCNSPVRPERFIRKMKQNTGMASGFLGILDENGLEFRNPLIVALGDSVTAGHFETLADQTENSRVSELFQLIRSGASSSEVADFLKQNGGLPPIEIFDARESYIEKFRGLLIDKYELTSLSVINSGIAGDTLPSMMRRAYRDVIRYDPDLILINGSLNWDDSTMGDAEVYKEMLRKLVLRLKAETDADIVLITPNGDLPNRLMAEPGAKVMEPTTPDRVRAIREVASEEMVCLADVRAVWDEARKAGCPWEELLANKVNHPGVDGHVVYAKVLMKLFEEQ